MPKRRRLQEKRGWGWTVVVALAKPALNAFSRRDWQDGMKIPAVGGCVLAVNHVSHLDPLAFGNFVYDHGRLVRYLAKEELFTHPLVGPLARSAGQIPVSRLSADAAKAFAAAKAAVEAGEVVGFYPEGTITRDPDGWPMRAKTGAARIALTTGCPVIPVGQWGAQRVLPAYSYKPHLRQRHTIGYRVGDPVDLDDLRAQVGEGSPSAALLAEATDRIMDAITALVAELRGETAPATRFDPRAAGVNQVGRPTATPQSAGGRG